MGNMHLKDLLAFLDNLIIFSKTLEEHKDRLIKVLSRLKKSGLKLSSEKCIFFLTSVLVLVEIREGVPTDPEKNSCD